MFGSFLNSSDIASFQVLATGCVSVVGDTGVSDLATLLGVAVGSVATSKDDSDSCDGTKNVWTADTWFHYAFRFSVLLRQQPFILIVL